MGAAIRARRSERDVIKLIGVRHSVRKRAQEGKEEKKVNQLVKVMGCIRKYKFREKAAVDYSLNEKTQPNWKDEVIAPKRDPISRVMKMKRKMGYQRCEVRASSLENAGQGLYARKNMKENDVICLYEGTEITKEQLDSPPTSTSKGLCCIGVYQIGNIRTQICWFRRAR